MLATVAHDELVLEAFRAIRRDRYFEGEQREKQSGKLVRIRLVVLLERAKSALRGPPAISISMTAEGIRSVDVRTRVPSPAPSTHAYNVSQRLSLPLVPWGRNGGTY